MNLMEKKGLVITIVAVIVVAAVIVFAVVGNRGSSNVPSPAGGAGNGTSPTTGPITRTAAPVDVVPPPANATNTSAEVAVPTSVAPANPTGSASARTFTLKAASGAFTPNEIIVTRGDTVTLNITAVDKDYDFTLPDYGVKAVIAQGSTKQIQFSPVAAGTFLFYCASCGGPQSGPTGHLVVVAQK